MGIFYSLGGILGYNIVIIVLVLIACLIARVLTKLSWLLIFVGIGLEIWSYVGNYKRNSILGFSNESLTMSFVIGLVIALIGIFIVSKRSLGTSRKYIKDIIKEKAEEEKKAGDLVPEKLLLMQDEEKSAETRIEATYWLWEKSTFPISDVAKDNFLNSLKNFNDENGKTMNKGSLQKMIIYYCREFLKINFSENSKEHEYLQKIKADLNIK